MSHETEHASKPFANPLGIMAGLVVLWVVAGGLVWLLLIPAALARLQLGPADSRTHRRRPAPFPVPCPPCLATRAAPGQVPRVTRA